MLLQVLHISVFDRLKEPVFSVQLSTNMKYFQLLVVAAVAVALVSSRAVEEGKRLVKTSEEHPGEWMTEEQIFELIRKKVTFIDITDFDYSKVNPNDVDTHAIPTELKFNSTVQRLINNLNSPRVHDFIEKFSSYYTRYYSLQPGRDSQLWLLSEVQSSVQGYAGNASVSEVDHGFLQKSIVARLEGSDPSLRSEVVIIGAHLDSVNILLPPILSAPGADDNGSGSVAILETLRGIVEAGIALKRTVEFQWYAAEEIGLRGSQAIAQEYKRQNVSVAAMLNFDVLAYHDGRNDIGIYTDNGNAQVQQFLRLLADGYLTYGRRDNTCGYGCSDHASWTNQGFPAAMVSEYTPHPDMHSDKDTIANMNFEQLNEFIKLSIGFVVELGEPASN